MMFGSMNLELIHGNPGGVNFENHFAQMGRIGFRVVRCSFLWHRVELTPNAPYNWDESDAMVYLAAKNRLQCQPSVGGYVAKKQPCPANPMPEGKVVKGFTKWVSALVKRYGPKGQFWSMHKEIPKKAFKVYEIWNEANLYKDFACNTKNPKPYAKLLYASAKSIKKVDKGAKIMFGGLAPLKNELSFFEQVFKINRNLKKMVHHVAYHPYASKASSAIKKIATLRKTMTKVGLSKKSQISLTEYGWLPSDAKTATPSGDCKTPQPDAALAKHEREFVKLVVNKRNSLGVMNIMPFQWWTPGWDCINRQWGVIADDNGNLLPKGVAYAAALKKSTK